MSQKVVLITGCSEPGSLGAALAKQFLGKGCLVFATARKLETLDGLRDAGCEVFALDVTSQESVDNAVDVVRSKAGRLDILVNNAGLATSYPLLSTPPSVTLSMFSVNVFGLLTTSSAFTPLLLETKSLSSSKPVILNIGSVAAWGIPWTGAYSASKAAVHCLSDTMRREMEPLGVRVMVVHLAGVNTPMAMGLKNATPASTEEDIIPPSSPYYLTWPNIDKIVSAEQAKQTAGAWTAEETAGKLVRKVLDTGEVVVYAGYGWQLFRFVFPYISVSMADWIFAKLKHTQLARLPVEDKKTA